MIDDYLCFVSVLLPLVLLPLCLSCLLLDPLLLLLLLDGNRRTKGREGPFINIVHTGRSCSYNCTTHRVVNVHVLFCTVHVLYCTALYCTVAVLCIVLSRVNPATSKTLLCSVSEWLVQYCLQVQYYTIL